MSLIGDHRDDFSPGHVSTHHPIAPMFLEAAMNLPLNKFLLVVILVTGLVLGYRACTLR